MGNSNLQIEDDEKDLLEQIAQGDERAFSIIMDRYANRIYPYLVYWLKQPELAEELLQDIFTSLWKYREKITGIDNFPGYIFVITRNKAKTALKQQMLGGQPINPDHLYKLTYGQTGQQELESKELMEILQRGIDQLPVRRKEVFLLSRKENLTYEEIAQRLGISRSAVRQHIVEALVFLRHYLKKNAGIIVSILAGFIL